MSWNRAAGAANQGAMGGGIGPGRPILVIEDAKGAIGATGVTAASRDGPSSTPILPLLSIGVLDLGRVVPLQGHGGGDRFVAKHTRRKRKRSRAPDDGQPRRRGGPGDVISRPIVPPLAPTLGTSPSEQMATPLLPPGATETAGVATTGGFGPSGSRGEIPSAEHTGAGRRACGTHWVYLWRLRRLAAIWFLPLQHARGGRRWPYRSQRSPSSHSLISRARLLQRRFCWDGPHRWRGPSRVRLCHVFRVGVPRSPPPFPTT